MKIKNKKISTFLFKIIRFNITFFTLYLSIGFIAGALALFMSIITLGGIAYNEAGGDPTFYNNLLNFVIIYFRLFKYTIYYIYFTTYIIFIRGIYINILSYKKLTNNQLQQNEKQNSNKIDNTNIV